MSPLLAPEVDMDKGDGVAMADAMLTYPPDGGKPFDPALGVDEVMRACADVDRMLNAMANVPAPVCHAVQLLRLCAASLAVCVRDLQRKAAPKSEADPCSP